MLPTNVRITSARYANAQNTLVFVLLDTGETWFVNPNNGSGQANVLAAWLKSGGNISPFVPPVPGGVVPPGSLIWYASPKVPGGYLLCDGRAVKRLQYPKLFAAIGLTFGPGDGVTTFNLPNLQNRMVRGWGPVNSLEPDRPFGSFQGDMIGTHKHSLTDPGHTHGTFDPGHLHGVNDPGHTHNGIDPGHTHSVSDPGHQHVITMYEISELGASSGSGNSVVTPDLSYTPYNGTYTPIVNEASAALTVNTGSANLFTTTGFADVSDKLGLTGITVNQGVTNIDYTDNDGALKTLCVSLALMPYIRY